MNTLGYYNGTVGELSEMKVPMLDRACYFGDGVYDVTYSRNHRIYCLDEHIDRFFYSAELTRITPNFSKQDLKNLLLSLVKKMDSGDLWVYVQLSRGTSLRNHAFPKEALPNLWVMLRPAAVRDTYLPMRCITGEDTRFFHCNVKSLNLLPNVLATEEAVSKGMDECILHRGETVTECAHSNLSVLKDGILYTHPADECIYAGTGRAHLLSLCHELEIPVREEPYPVSFMMAADEIIVTSASAFCVQVSEIDSVRVGGKAPHILRTLQDALVKDFNDKTAEI